MGLGWPLYVIGLLRAPLVLIMKKMDYHKTTSRVAVKCLIRAATTTAADWSKPSQP